MANETRVNLKHLLEDLRDAYTVPLATIIVTELIANALDSGASQIALTVMPDERTFRCVDNGGGMNRSALKQYHNIAASTKERGAGIGFAGVGAKLSLLVAEKVITETKGTRGTRGAAEWHLQSPYRAPWKFIPFSGSIDKGRGTAVTIVLKDDAHPLIDEENIRAIVRRAFFPLVCETEGLKKIYKKLYRRPMSILVNGAPVKQEALPSDVRHFFVKLGNTRTPIGAGFIQKARMDQSFWQKMIGADPARPSESGMHIATYGKVIKGGWEWLGLEVKHPELFTGVVEVPECAQILTTNKADFLTDQQSLKKYYKIRKAIQRALLPVLTELGAVEEHERGEAGDTPARIKRLAGDLEGALSLMSPAFPELDALVGEHWKRMRASEGEKGKKKKKKKADAMEGIPADGDSNVGAGTDGEQASGEHKEGERAGASKERTNTSLTEDAKGTRTKRQKKPALSIELADFTGKEKNLLGKLVGETIMVNTAHHAWKRASAINQEPYHVIITVALTLGEYLQPDDGIGAFVSTFLSAWSTATEKSGKLL